MHTPRWFRFVLSAGAAAALAPLASAQEGPAFSCFANAGTPPIVRAEGMTELVGDIVLNCTGGTVPVPGSPLPTANIGVSLNTRLTSKLLVASSSYSEALLLLDEPQPGQQFLGTTNPTNTAACTPSPTCPNVFVGQVNGPNGIVFLKVPVSAPGKDGERVYRITNIRANAAQLVGPFDNPGPETVPILLDISASTGGTPILINNPRQTVAFVQQGINFSVANTTSFSAADSQAGRAFTLRYTENFATAFKRRFFGDSFTNPPASPPDQNVPGVPYHETTESGFIPNFTDLARPYVSGIGVVDTGMLLNVTLQNLPQGGSFYPSVTNLNPNPNLLVRLVSGLPPYTPVPDQGNGFANLNLVCPDRSKDCTLTYRVYGSDPNAIDTYLFQMDYVKEPTTPENVTRVTGATPTVGPYPSFQGYVIAACNFQFAHGFAFISDLGARNLAMGYLSLIIPDPTQTPEASGRVGVTENRGEQVQQIRAAAVPTLTWKEQGTGNSTLRFELTSEGYLPKHVVIGSFGTMRLSGLTVTPEVGASPGQASGDSWLHTEANSDATPVTVVVSVDATGLAPGTYQGDIRITSSLPGVQPNVIPVELVVPPPGPRVRTIGVASAGSYANSVVAPGEAVVVFGSNFGPAEIAGLELVDGVVATQIGDTRILFDGEPAPMIYTVNGQASCFVPYAVEGKQFTEMVVEYQGVASPLVRLAVSPVKPAILTANQSGGGIGAILNEDNSFNVLKAAKAGEVIQIFGVGGGQTTPPSIGGRVQAGVAEYNVAVRAFVDGVEVPTIYAGPAPGLVEGVFQVNLRLPADTRSGEVPLLIRFGDDLHTQPGVTVSVE